MAKKSSGFKTAGAEKPLIKELPKPKWNIPWRWLAALIAIPVLVQQCGQDDPKTRTWKNNTDTAPKQTSHDWLDKMNKRNAERAAEGLPPLKRAPVDAERNTSRSSASSSRVEQRREFHRALDAENALPSGPGVEARRGGFRAVFAKLYSLPGHVTAEVDRVMTHRDPGQPIYDTVKVDRDQSFHIASARVTDDQTTNSFVCVEDRGRVKDFFHAQTAPDGKGGYKVAINNGMPHQGNYMTNMNLMEAFGNKTCFDGLRRLHQEMNGTGETESLNKTKSARDSERNFNDRGMKGLY